MIRLYLFLIIFIFLPALASANSCRTLTNTINADITRYSDTLKNHRLPWMNFMWLQQQLGAADSKNISDGKTQYHWRCETEGSYLVAIVDTNGNLLKLKGQYNSDNGSGLFAIRLPKSEVPFEAIKPEMKTSPPVLLKADAVSNMIANRLDQYNEHYHTHFQQSTELDNDMLQRIKNYYASLRQCQKGTYEFALPVLQDFLFNTAVISSQQDGRCQVKVSYVIPQIGNIDLKCRYQMQSLQLYTDAEAEAVVRGVTQFDSEHPTALQTVVANECKRYIDGVL